MLRASPRHGTYGSRNGSRSLLVSAEGARTPPPRSTWPTRLFQHLFHAQSCTRLRPRSAQTCRSSFATARNSEPVTERISPRLELPADYVVLLLEPEGVSKDSTAAIYGRFDERGAAAGFEERRSQLLRRARAHGGGARSRDASRERSRLVSAPAASCEALGAFRADVTGAGPVVYGLFDDQNAAERAASSLRSAGRTWVVRPVRQRMAR